MITLRALAELAAQHPEALSAPVAKLAIGDRVFDTDVEPVLMGTLNLSPDSTYRESIALSTEAAIRKARVQAAQGAHLIDIGAESSTAKAARVGADGQVAALLPVIRELADDGIVVSVEAYDPSVLEPALEAGARVINLTGSAFDDQAFRLAVDYDATVVLCHVAGDNVREIVDAPDSADPFASMIEHFERRLTIAADKGVDNIAIDPGLGFYYKNLTDPATRLRYQTSVLLSTFRLRPLGKPVCHALPHAFALFEDEFRTAEGFFAVLARLGGTGVFRTHEVQRVRAVLEGMSQLSVDLA